MPTYRTAYRYHFKLGNKIVYTGVTADIYYSELEHRRERGWKKGHIKQVGVRTTRDIAFAWLREQAQRGKPVDPDYVYA